MNETDLFKLPHIERLLSDPRIELGFPRLSRPLVSRLASRTLAALLESLRAGGEREPGGSSAEELEGEALSKLEEACSQAARRRVSRVVNATGVILHANLGRFPLGAGLWEAALVVNNNAATLFLILSCFARKREVLV
jgi:L-seryl-tRNA(Ser) seleniumtransferase